MDERKIVNITGGTGVLGRNLVNVFTKNGFSVNLYQRNESFGKFSEKVNVCQGDLFNIENIRNISKSEGSLFHLAAITDPPSKDSLIMAQVITINGYVPAIIAFCRKLYKNESPYIYLSSGIVFWLGDQRTSFINEGTAIDLQERNPQLYIFVQDLIDYFDTNLEIITNGSKTIQNMVEDVAKKVSTEIEKKDKSIFNDPQIYPYKIAKLLAEILIPRYFPAHIVRLAHIYGKGDMSEFRALPSLVKSLVQGYIGYYPDLTRDFVYLDDVTGVLYLLEGKKNEKVEYLHISSGQNVTAEEVLCSIETLFPQYVNKMHIINSPFCISPPIFSNEKMKHLLGRDPVSFNEGLSAYLNWAHDNLKEQSDDDIFFV